MFLVFFLAVENYLTLAGTGGRGSEPIDENDVARGIIQKMKEGIDDCHQQLNDWLGELCVDLNEPKRMNLTTKVMICEFSSDNRQSTLPPFRGDTREFVESLSESQYDIFTTYFISMDSLCFHYASETQAEANLKKVDYIFQAVNFSTEFIRDMKRQVVRDYERTKDSLNAISDRITDSSDLVMSLFQDVDKVLSRINKVNEKAKRFRQSLSNSKTYATTVFFTFLLSFVLPEVFLPIVCITGVWLFFETTGPSWMTHGVGSKGLLYSYIIICGTILCLSFMKELQTIKEKFFPHIHQKDYDIHKLHSQ